MISDAEFYFWIFSLIASCVGFVLWLKAKSNDHYVEWIAELGDKR